MKKLMKNKRGEGYIDTVVCVLAAMMVIVLALNVFSFLTLKQDLDYFAKEMIDVTTTYGRTSGEANTRYSELCSENGTQPILQLYGNGILQRLDRKGTARRYDLRDDDLSDIYPRTRNIQNTAYADGKAFRSLAEILEVRR